MFKNMLLEKNSGENFPIKIPEDLLAKLEVFNKFSNLPIITLRVSYTSFSRQIKRCFTRKSIQQEFEEIICRRTIRSLNISIIFFI